MSDEVEATFGERLPHVDYRRRPGVYAISMETGGVLVVDAPAGRYLPGGGLDPGEEPLDALAREVREETGYDVLSASPLARASQLIVERATGDAIDKAGEFFVARLSPAAVRRPADPDHVARVVDVAEALETLTEEAHRSALRRALETAPAAGGCQCPSEIDPRIARFFDRENRARRAGQSTYVMGKVTHALLRALLASGPSGRTILEPGCGPAGLLRELLAAGATSATGLDLSAEAVAFAGERLAEAGARERATLLVGDAATMELPTHDWVVLDKVICCYAHADRLLHNTIRAAGELYAFAIPSSSGWRGFVARAIIWLENATNGLRGRPCPGYVHDVGAIEGRLARAGFAPAQRQLVGLWHVGVYVRSAASPSA